MTPGREVAVFFLLSCLISWPLWGYNFYCRSSKTCEYASFLTHLGSIGPFIAALLLTFRKSGFHGVKHLFESSYKYDKKAWRWIILSVMLPVVLFITGAFLYQVLGDGPEVHFDAFEFVSVLIAGLMAYPLEETGWRGFALPRVFESVRPAPEPKLVSDARETSQAPSTRSIRPARPPRPPHRQSKAESIIVPSMLLGTMTAVFRLPLFLYQTPFVPLDQSFRGIGREIMYYTTGLDLLSIIVTIIWLRCSKTTTTAVIFAACSNAAIAALQVDHIGKLFSYVAAACVPVAIVMIQRAPSPI